MIFLKKTYGEWTDVKELLMWQVKTLVVDDEKEIISLMAENLVYIVDDDTEHEPDND